jgi:CDP-paratose 2-epimerase
MTQTVRSLEKPVLVTGGAGFIGCNIADRLARDGHAVHIYDCLARPGVEANLAWLQSRHPKLIRFTRADIRDTKALEDAARDAKAVFHMAAQVAVTTSLVDPREDFAINVQGTFELIDILRRRNPAPLIMASTNKVYGDLADVPLALIDDRYAPADEKLRQRGINENHALNFHTPYGCSKGAAEQYVLDASRSFDMRTAVLRMSCIYGPRQMGTEDQGWVAHFLLRALASEPIVLFGDGRQVRDILSVHDAVEAYMAAWRRIDDIRGQAFNLGGGPRNAVSLLQLIAQMEEIVGRRIQTSFAPWRAGDQRYYVSDTRRAAQALALAEPISWKDGVAELAEWLRQAGSGGKYRRASAGALS